MWICHCYEFPLSLSKQSTHNHLGLILSWRPGKILHFQLPPRLGDTIRHVSSSLQSKSNSSLVPAGFFQWSVTRAEAAYITKEDGVFTSYCPVRSCKHIHCIYICWVHIHIWADNSTLKACFGARLKAHHGYKNRLNGFFALSSFPDKNSHLPIGLSRRETARCVVKVHITNTS